MVLAIITAVESLSLLIIAIIGVTYSPCTIDYGYRYGCGGYYSCLSYYPPCSDHVMNTRYCSLFGNWSFNNDYCEA